MPSFYTVYNGKKHTYAVIADLLFTVFITTLLHTFAPFNFIRTLVGGRRTVHYKAQKQCHYTGYDDEEVARGYTNLGIACNVSE